MSDFRTPDAPILYIWLVGRFLKNGQDEAVVVAATAREAIALMGGPMADYAAEQIGIASPGRQLGVVMANQWSA